MSLHFQSIASKDNDRIKLIRQLKDSKASEQSGLFLLEGEQILIEALERRVVIKTVVLTETSFNAQFAQGEIAQKLEHHAVNAEYLVVPDKIMSGISTLSSPPGMLATAIMPRADLGAALHELSQAGGSTQLTTFLVLEQIQDPGNLGTAIRSALSFACDGLILTTGSCDPYSPKAVRAAMGALFSLPVYTDIEPGHLIEICKASGVDLICFDIPGEEMQNFVYPSRCALVFGNEGKGLSQNMRQAADSTVTIAMQPSSIESLNVSIAASLALHDRFIKTRPDVHRD